MRTLKLTATLMLLGALTLSAATIDEQIAAIGAAATPEERVALVNEFKETISALSADERADAISELRASMSKDGDQLQTQTRQRTRERSRVDQMQQTEDMQKAQQMQQKQAGSQAMQQGQLGGGSGGAGGQGPNRFMGNR